MKKKQENSRETILACALQLFASSGYDATGINEITEQAGITKPTLYYFFGSKEGLFNALLGHHYNILKERLENICSVRLDPRDCEDEFYKILLELAGMYFEFSRQYKDFYLMSLSLAFAPPTSKPGEMALPYHKMQYVIIGNIFVQFAAVHPHLQGQEMSISYRFLSLINSQIAFWHRGYATIEKHDAEALVKQFMHGIYAM